MNKLVGIVITVLVVLSMIPIAITMSDEYNYASEEESFVAINDVTTPEEVTLSETPVEVTRVTVEGVDLTVTTEYTVSGDVVTIASASSVVDDVIVVYYTYEMTTNTAQDTLVQLLPTLLIIALVVGIAIKLKMGK